MFAKIKSTLENMGTIKLLCTHAERHALGDQQREPRAEHFLLAALDLPDATARQAFDSIGADATGFRAAIARQYDDALQSIGIDPAISAVNGQAQETLAPRLGLYDASESGKQVLQRLAEHRQSHEPLLGAHVVAIVAAMKHSVAARALRAMGIDESQLKAAAETIATRAQR